MTDKNYFYFIDIKSESDYLTDHSSSSNDHTVRLNTMKVEIDVAECAAEDAAFALMVMELDSVSYCNQS